MERSHQEKDDLYPFLHPYNEIEFTENRLPHWQQVGGWVFVTWRLADSLPTGLLRDWQEQRELWVGKRPRPWDERTEKEFHRLFSDQLDCWLDQGMGACVLRNTEVSRIVSDSLLYFEGDRYEMASFVVMPNHLHALFRPMRDWRLASLIHSWKSFTAKKINHRLGKEGSVWQRDYWDRLIRNERHFFKTMDYIRRNPIEARLRDGEYLLWKRDGS